jgi:hypothetical protein
MTAEERYRALADRGRELGLEVIVAILPLDVQPGEYLVVKAPITDEGHDLSKCLDVIEGHIAVAEMAVGR